MSVSKVISVVLVAEKYLGEKHTFRDVKVMLYLLDKTDEKETFKNLRKNLRMSPVEVTRSLKHLQDNGLVELFMDEIDTRKKVITITDKAKALKLSIIELIGGN
jgi:DNA-binding MarR family transcriptional regulator